MEKKLVPKVTAHPVHGVSTGKDIPKYVNAIIEIPKGSQAKYEVHKETGLLVLDRVLFSSVHYPTNYGFIPRTHCDDNDPLDILVISSIDIQPLCIVEAKIIGAMHMHDGDQIDDKLIAVARHDISVKHINCLEELPPYAMKGIKRFFEDYKKLEDKKVEIEEFVGKEEAFKILEDSIELYKQTFE